MEESQELKKTKGHEVVKVSWQEICLTLMQVGEHLSLRNH